MSSIVRPLRESLTEITGTIGDVIIIVIVVAIIGFIVKLAGGLSSLQAAFGLGGGGGEGQAWYQNPATQNWIQTYTGVDIRGTQGAAAAGAASPTGLPPPTPPPVYQASTNRIFPYSPISPSTSWLASLGLGPTVQPSQIQIANPQISQYTSIMWVPTQGPPVLLQGPPPVKGVTKYLV